MKKIKNIVKKIKTELKIIMFKIKINLMKNTNVNVGVDIPLVTNLHILKQKSISNIFKKMNQSKLLQESYELILYIFAL
jgi:hypothetical protein